MYAARISYKNEFDRIQAPQEIAGFFITGLFESLLLRDDKEGDKKILLIIM